jgi:hypothetical protein
MRRRKEKTVTEMRETLKRTTKKKEKKKLNFEIDRSTDNLRCR